MIVGDPAAIARYKSRTPGRVLGLDGIPAKRPRSTSGPPDDAQ